MRVEQYTKRTFIVFHETGFYFRIKGVGLSIEKSKGYQKLFSERYGYTKPFYIFGLRISVLKTLA